MDKQKILYAFNDDMKWEKLLKDIDNINRYPEVVEKIAVIAFGTAILSILKSTSLEEIKSKIAQASHNGIDFYVCGNTMRKYGITADQLLPQIKIAQRGTDIQILEMKEEGFYLFTII